MSEDRPTTDETLREINRLFEEDLDIGRQTRKLERSRNIRMRYFNLRIQEEVAPIDTKLAALVEQRGSLRKAILELWTRDFGPKRRLDLPIGTASRRNHREVVIRDKAKLLDALDRIDRLDLADYVFNERQVLRLMDKGKLALASDVLEVIDHLVLQLRSKGV